MNPNTLDTLQPDDCPILGCHRVGLRGVRDMPHCGDRLVSIGNASLDATVLREAEHRVLECLDDLNLAVNCCH